MEILVAIIFAGFLISISATDLKTMMIYERILLPMAAVGILFDALGFLVSVGEGILYFALGFILMFAIYIISRGGMGGGDVKFCAVLGLWLGKNLLAAIFLASMLAAIFAVFLAIKNRDLKSQFPFGPFLSAGSFFIYFSRILGS